LRMLVVHSVQEVFHRPQRPSSSSVSPKLSPAYFFFSLHVLSEHPLSSDTRPLAWAPLLKRDPADAPLCLKRKCYMAALFRYPGGRLFCWTVLSAREHFSGAGQLFCMNVYRFFFLQHLPREPTWYDCRRPVQHGTASPSYSPDRGPRSGSVD